MGIFGGAEIVRGGRTLRFEGDESEMDGGWLGGEDEEETRWVGGGGEDLMDGWDRARVRLYI